MLNLLKADFVKMKHEKSFLVLAIIILGFCILNTSLYLLLEDSIDGYSITGKNEFVVALNGLSNMGMIIPIILVIYVTKEFTYGTIRNKVICGYDKKYVFLTCLIESLVIGIIAYIINAFLSLIAIGVFFEFGGITFAFIIKNLLLGILIYCSMITITICLSFLVKKLGITILLYFGIMIGLTMLSILASIDNPVTRFLSNINPAYQFGELASALPDIDGNIDKITNFELIEMIVSNIVFIGGFTALGCLIADKSDIK